MVIVQCDASREVCGARLRARAQESPHPDAGLEVRGLKLLDGDEFPWETYANLDVEVPALAVSTVSGYSPDIEAMLEFVVGRAASL